MAEATKTTATVLTPHELENEILSQLFRELECNLTPGEIRRGLSTDGVTCEAKTLGRSLGSMYRQGLIDMPMEDGSTLDEIVVRFRLTPAGRNLAAQDIRTHYPGDGCVPDHAIPDDVTSMVPPKDRSK